MWDDRRRRCVRAGRVGISSFKSASPLPRAVEVDSVGMKFGLLERCTIPSGLWKSPPTQCSVGGKIDVEVPIARCNSVTFCVCVCIRASEILKLSRRRRYCIAAIIPTTSEPNANTTENTPNVVLVAAKSLLGWRIAMNDLKYCCF